MPSSVPFDVTSISGVTVAVFRPAFSQIDEAVVDLVSRKLIDLVETLSPPNLVLDMTHVDFFGSSFIEAMFRSWKRLQSRPNAKFALCGLKPYCREVLEVTHLDELWPIFATKEEALEQWKST